MKMVCVIPARYASTRLPGKPLVDIGGKPMIQRVYEQAIQAKCPATVLVATDDERIAEAVKGFGGQYVMTSPDHKTGTDRLAEVARIHDEYDVIINIQGDEPLIEPELIDRLGALFTDNGELEFATVSAPLAECEYDDPSAVKVVTDCQGYALYFSRSLIPFPRNAFVKAPRKHLGIYAYTRKFLLEFAQLSQTPAEQTESLEQLRALEWGHRIRLIECDGAHVGVDTPEDLERVRAIIAQKEIG